jgi:hypothetical protein
MKKNIIIYVTGAVIFMLLSFDRETKWEQKVITLKKNGGWCWYQDERAIIKNNVLLFGSVANPSGSNGDVIGGNVEVTAYDLKRKKLLGTSVIHENLEADDHNAPALLQLNDGNLLAIYAKHGSDNKIRYRKTADSQNNLNWNDEKSIEHGVGVTYSNLLFLSEENNGHGRTYNFFRGENWNPNYIFSDDRGETWNKGGRLITFAGRPYVKYISNDKNRIHFITTEHHPMNFPTSIYHAYLENGKLFKSNGSFIKNLSDGPMKPDEGTLIFDGDSLNIAWTIDIHLDEQGNPYIAYEVQQDNDPAKLKYRYASWDGYQWNDFFLAHAGTALYDAEPFYSGLVALDPQNPQIVYISTDINPVTGKELISTKDHKRHYELFKGITSNKGKNWSWEAITSNSDFDNIRPIVPQSSEFQVLLWLKGEYTSYTDYNLDVVGIINLKE